MADAGTSLRNDKSLVQLGRDSVEMIALGDKKIAITKWFDNKPVLMASAGFGIAPLVQVWRWHKKEKKYVHSFFIGKEMKRNMFIHM